VYNYAALAGRLESKGLRSTATPNSRDNGCGGGCKGELKEPEPERLLGQTKLNKIKAADERVDKGVHAIIISRRITESKGIAN
jgi:hypothetical protein